MVGKQQIISNVHLHWHFLYSLHFLYLRTMRNLLLLLLLLITNISIAQLPVVVILGNVQDAGSPHIGCTKDCCRYLFPNPDSTRKVVSLGLIDTQKKYSYLFEASPDIGAQLRLLRKYSMTDTDVPNGIFLTHAHIGHYAGLMYLGREALNSKQVPVFAMPRMKQFLEQNGPWNQLVALQNIMLQPLQDQQPITLSNELQVQPFLVPHRDEYSETVGYRITGSNKKVLFIPDIDKWEKWTSNIIHEIAAVDYAFIDATFFDASEVNNRNINEIPHPFIVESMQRFADLPTAEKKKIYFIHFNHTNPALNINSSVTQQIKKAGFNIARLGDLFTL